MQSPHSVLRSWDMSKEAPTTPADSRPWLALSPAKKLFVRTLSAPQPIEVDMTPEMTVAELKAQISVKMFASPRKALGLRWYGADLDDQQLLTHYRIPDGATLQMSMHARTQAEMELLKQVRQLRVRTMEGKVAIIDGVKPATRVGEIKKAIAERKAFGPIPNFDAKNPVCELLYSTVFNSSFGISLEDEKTLGSYGMLNDDVLLFKPPLEEAEEDAKKKGDKKEGKKKK